MNLAKLTWKFQCLKFETEKFTCLLSREKKSLGEKFLGQSSFLTILDREIFACIL